MDEVVAEEDKRITEKGEVIQRLEESADIVTALRETRRAETGWKWGKWASVRATAVGRNAVLAGDPKGIRLLCNTSLITNVPSRGSKEERISTSINSFSNSMNSEEGDTSSLCFSLGSDAARSVMPSFKFLQCFQAGKEGCILLVVFFLFQCSEEGFALLIVFFWHLCPPPPPSLTQHAVFPTQCHHNPSLVETWVTTARGGFPANHHLPKSDDAHSRPPPHPPSFKTWVREFSSQPPSSNWTSHPLPPFLSLKWWQWNAWALPALRKCVLAYRHTLRLSTIVVHQTAIFRRLLKVSACLR